MLHRFYAYIVVVIQKIPAALWSTRAIVINISFSDGWREGRKILLFLRIGRKGREKLSRTEYTYIAFRAVHPRENLCCIKFIYYIHIYIFSPPLPVSLYVLLVELYVLPASCMSRIFKMPRGDQFARNISWIFRDIFLTHFIWDLATFIIIYNSYKMKIRVCVCVWYYLYHLW